MVSRRGRGGGGGGRSAASRGRGGRGGRCASRARAAELSPALPGVRLGAAVRSAVAPAEAGVEDAASDDGVAGEAAGPELAPGLRVPGSLSAAAGRAASLAPSRDEAIGGAITGASGVDAAAAGVERAPALARSASACLRANPGGGGGRRRGGSGSLESATYLPARGAPRGTCMILAVGARMHQRSATIATTMSCSTRAQSPPSCPRQARQTRPPFAARGETPRRDTSGPQGGVAGPRSTLA